MKTMAVTAVAATAVTAAAQVPGRRAGNEGMSRRYAPEFPVVVNPDIPSTVVFAGDTISFDRVDMAERLDRELTGIAYGHSQMLLCFKRANKYFPILVPILKEQGLSLDLLYLAVTESTMDPAIKSPAGAVGLWQFMPATAREYGLEVNDDVDERCDPVKETIAACKFLKRARDKYGDWATACASYNAGGGRISGELTKQGQSTSFDLQLVSETSRYMFRIIAYKLIMENPRQYGYCMRTSQLYQPMDYDVEEVKTSVSSWVDWAKQHGISYAQLRDANPWIRSNRLLNRTGKTYKVNIPKKEDLYLSSKQLKAYSEAWVVD